MKICSHQVSSSLFCQEEEITPSWCLLHSGEEGIIGHMHTRYAAYTQRLITGVLNSPGEIDPILRRAVEEYSARLSSGTSHQVDQLPPELVSYVNKVALHAYKTTREDIEALRTAGYSEDAIFEITLSVALGAGLARLERGLVVLQGGTDAAQED